MSRLTHSETHMVHRIGWLRAAVMGANDGIVSTSSLIVGVAAAGTAPHFQTVLIELFLLLLLLVPEAVVIC